MQEQTDHGVPISVVVMTYNEETNIERCLDSIQGWTGEVFIVDSFSTDRTLEAARRYTTKIFQHEYEGHPQQWRWALETLPFAYDWIFAVDADFQVTPALWMAIRDALAEKTSGVAGYYVRHRQVFRGRFLRYGTMYPRYWLRVFRREAIGIDPHDLVDVHFYVDGRVGRLEHDVIEDNRKEQEMAFWVQKQIRFAQRHALEELRRRNGKADTAVRPTIFGTPDQRTLWLKDQWYKLPLYVRPFLLFFYRYVLRLGFLDGKEGFLYHFSQALLYRLMVDVRIEELRRQAISEDLPGTRGWSPVKNNQK
jgi:glycosyltransferase involved in cell wall biosynthesis